MDSSAEVSGFSAAPPPVGSLGCYKGVMLCNRAPDEPSKRGAGEVNHQLPFKSTISATHRDQVGLPPGRDAKRIEPGADVKTRGPSAALRRHCQWIKELQEQVRDDQKQAESSEKTHQERQQRMKEAFKRQRNAIQELKKQDRGSYGVQPHEIEAILRPKGEGKAQQQRSMKPLWAMTEAEREGVEEDEAEELIRFAEGVDFDQYINDLEFRQSLEAVRDRAKRIQQEQDAFKDSILQEFNSENPLPGEGGGGSSGDDEHSSSVGANSRRRRHATSRGRPRDDWPDGRPEWDASTACGDDARALDREGQAAAEWLLGAHPQLRGVHSKGSVQRLIERASEQGSVSGLSV
mmetsp:Transcript_32325/g.75007  ORF Transcript_32325/g.75007 Transcript_32325/m.75007 type:complete len:349 (-) Transcript_32325:149-1195(-)